MTGRPEAWVRRKWVHNFWRHGTMSFEARDRSYKEWEWKWASETQWQDAWLMARTGATFVQVTLHSRLSITICQHPKKRTRLVSVKSLLWICPEQEILKSWSWFFMKLNDCLCSSGERTWFEVLKRVQAAGKRSAKGCTISLLWYCCWCSRTHLSVGGRPMDRNVGKILSNL